MNTFPITGQKLFFGKSRVEVISVSPSKIRGALPAAARVMFKSDNGSTGECDVGDLEESRRPPTILGRGGRKLKLQNTQLREYLSHALMCAHGPSACETCQEAKQLLASYPTGFAQQTSPAQVIEGLHKNSESNNPHLNLTNDCGRHHNG